MTVCKNCGVELQDNMNFCPLCGYPVQKNVYPERPVEIQSSTESPNNGLQVSKLNKLQKRKLIWEVASLILVSGTLVVVLLNFILHQTISWASYPIVFGLSLFAAISVFTFWHKNRWLQLIGTFTIIFITLLTIDLIQNGLQWFFPVALPLLAAAYLIGTGIYAITRTVRIYGFLLIADAFIGLAALAMLTEGLLSWYNTHTLNLEWSIIFSISVIPVASILFYIHFRLKKQPDLKKIFHI